MQVRSRTCHALSRYPAVLGLIARAPSAELFQLDRMGKAADIRERDLNGEGSARFLRQPWIVNLEEFTKRTWLAAAAGVIAGN